MRESKPPESSVSEAAFETWVADVREAGKWGPSPKEAQRLLGCSRAAIDYMVRTGVLERSEYERDGHQLVVISWRSIKQVQQNKAETNRFTGNLQGRPRLA